MSEQEKKQASVWAYSQPALSWVGHWVTEKSVKESQAGSCQLST